MCFSAEASFTGSAIISAIGIASIAKAKQPTQMLFAGVPFIFGIQQLSEGVVWVTLKFGGHEWLLNEAVHLFLITALVIWPMMIPLAMWLMEKAEKRKRILLGLMMTGGILSIFYSFCLVSYDVTSQIQSFHIQYIYYFPSPLATIASGFYLVSTVAPLFVSSIRRIWLMGALIVASYFVSALFFSQYLTSVWCFFAAVISVVIFWILAEPAPMVSRIRNDDRYLFTS